MSTVPAPRAVLFDWDNTLVDTWAIIHDAMNVTLDRFELPRWTLQETRTRVARSMRDSFPDLFGNDWETASDIFYGHFESIHLDKLEPLPGVIEFLDALQAADVYMGVVSNKRGDFLRRESTHLGWDRYFGGLVGAMDAARDKPAADPVHMALGGGSVAPGPDVWFVGDTGVDLMTAVEATCTPVLVRPESPAEGEFEGHSPAFYAPDFKALSKLLGSL